MKVKICGITSSHDAELAIQAGADAIGVNMVAGPRRVTGEAAMEIIACARQSGFAEPPEPCPVVLAGVSDGCFDPEVDDVIRRANVKWIQLYGDVSPSIVRAQRLAGREAIFVQRIADAGFAVTVNTFLAACGDYPPSAVALDAYHRDKLGGTGESFRWSWVVEARARGALADWPPIVLAGGLTPDNVAEAIHTVDPWAVDVSSGVEASQGRKDPIRLRKFVAQARAASGGGEGLRS
jgi:phosphoribosylanthranilate isomerase